MLFLEMPDKPSSSGQKLYPLLFGLPWLDILAEVYRVGHKLWQGMADEGMYEVDEHEVTIALHDAKGKLAIYHKRQQIRYRQNHIIALQDEVWSDGKPPEDYQCSPGVVVDQYHPAQTKQTVIMLISLRDVRQKGDTDLFESQCSIKDCFSGIEGFWQTVINHRTHQATINAIFPEPRPPHKVWGVEALSKRRHKDLHQSLRQLADGRWQVSWLIERPRLNERYTLHWLW